MNSLTILTIMYQVSGAKKMNLNKMLLVELLWRCRFRLFNCMIYRNVGILVQVLLKHNFIFFMFHFHLLLRLSLNLGLIIKRSQTHMSELRRIFRIWRKAFWSASIFLFLFTFDPNYSTAWFLEMPGLWICWYHTVSSLARPRDLVIKRAISRARSRVSHK